MGSDGVDGDGVDGDSAGDVRDGRLDVPGARLYYKIRGSGPPLLILPGGDGTADTSDGLVQQLASRWTVICYDRRGLSRSQPRDPAAELSVTTHGDDARQVLAALASQPAVVLGVSIGALIALDLATRYPDQVRAVIAHEPPAPQFLPEPERTEFTRAQEAVEEAFKAGGPAAAMPKFMVLAGVDPTDREPDAPWPAPGGDRAANLAFFLSHDAPAVRRHRVDLAGLRAAGTTVIPAAGRNSRQPPQAAAAALAGLLGVPMAEFPGGHSGWIFRPREFAATLNQVLDALGEPDSGHWR